MTDPIDVVAAIDFGTHGTGYAWTEVTRNADGSLTPVRRVPNYREHWPGTDSYYPKDLTAVMLDAGGAIVRYGHEAKQEWARRSMNGAAYGYAAGFKMALKADAYRGLEAPGAGTVRIDSVQKAYPLVVAFLRRTYRMALRDIQDSGYLEKQIRWCLTVPAIWDDAEKQLMRDAAGEAGLPVTRDRLLLALEPEAAAVYCRVHMARLLRADGRQRRQIAEPGARFMVVDCGGGTVDITAFRVETDSYGIDRMIEIGRVSGGKLGSEYINEEFVTQVLHDRLGGVEVLDRIRRECPHALLELIERWESQKVNVRVRRRDRRFPVLEHNIYLSIPGEIEDLLSEADRAQLAAQPGGNPHRIVVAPEEAKRVFDKVVVEIMEQVDQQLKEIGERDGRRDGPERLLLVGGLANSEYLQESLRAMFHDSAEILVPANPAAAVLFGAVQYGCDSSVVLVRRARYTFGLRISRPFERGLDDHRPAKDRFSDSRGALWCRNRFQVFVTNGEAIRAGQPKTEIVYPLRDEASLTLGFFRTLELAPRYVDDRGCEEIGHLTIPFGDAMRRPVDERAVEVQLRFGDTDIFATAVNVHTREQVEIILRFESTVREPSAREGATQ